MNKKIVDIIKNYSFLKNERDFKLELLENQGLCNTTYLLKTVTNRYIIKRFDKLPNNNVSKKAEFKIQLLAYKNRIAPKPIFFDIKNRIMISAYQKSYHKFSLSKTDLHSIAKTVTKLHKIKIHTKAFDIKKYFRKNCKGIDAKIKLTILKLQNYKRDLVLCHNDLNPQNILFGEKTSFIDWEFACMNDRYFDIASIIVEFNLNTKDENYFLHSYFKHKTPNREKLKVYKTLYKHLCKIWFDIISQKKGRKCQEQF